MARQPKGLRQFVNFLGYCRGDVTPLPEGTLTFMLTDLQGSTHAWDRQPKAMRTAMVRHDTILAGAVGNHKGHLVEAGREGDSVLAVFTTAALAADCALEIQERFATESWPDGLDLNVRVALHTGEAQARDGHYFGAALNRCARLLALCHPGQILLSKATESMLADEVPADAELQDLGPHRLKDLARPEHVFQLNNLARRTDFPAIQSLTQQRTNMPRYLTTFVGREADLSALKSMLANSRLVTLTGAGGSGKTRLAVELGWSCLELWPDGVWWVDLTAVNEPGLVPGAAVTTLQLPGRGPALDVLAAWLARRRAILVLDNCEHLVAACARFCEALLQRCPELTLLTTTREPLGVLGEVRWPVSSMRATDAVGLFEARARLGVPEFKVATSNLDTVTQICEHLDGMPLAIELAAARVGMMTEREVLGQLADRFALLTGGSRTAPDRQQTMIATIDWSYQLLKEKERVLFRRLSVFRGGFTLESAQAVCAEPGVGSVLDAISGLVQKSMVVADRAEDSGTRYRLLESQLAYAEDRLREGQELVAMRRRHYEYFRKELSDRSSDRLTVMLAGLGVVEAVWKARELSNLWAAMEWSRTDAADLGLSFAVDLSIIPQVDATQARRLLADVLDHSPEKGASRAIALIRASGLAQIQGDSLSGVTTVTAGLALARELRDPELVAHALIRAGALHADRGELQTAAEEYEEAVSLIKGAGNRRLLAPVQNNIAILAMERGDFSLACDILVECVAAASADGDVFYAAYLDSLAAAQLGVGDKEAASAGFKEALSRYRSLHFHRGVITCLQGLSRVAGAGGDDKRAVRLAAAATQMSSQLSLMDDPWATRFTEDSLQRSRARLGPAKSDEAWNQGLAMPLDQVIGYALGEIEPKSVIDTGLLSRREQEVAILVANGLTNRQIGEKLFITPRSAEGHVERIRNKLGVRSRSEVATWAVEHGLIPASVKQRGTLAGPLSTERRKPS